MALINIDDITYQSWLKLQNPKIQDSLMERMNGETLYHVSPNATIRRFFPSIPSLTKLDEDRTIPRICTSTTIIDAVCGMMDTSGMSRFKDGELTIYTFNPKVSIRPTKKLLPNVSNLNERWIVGYDPTYKAYESEVDGKIKIIESESVEGVCTIIGYIYTYSDSRLFKDRHLDSEDVTKFWLTVKFDVDKVVEQELSIQKIGSGYAEWSLLK